MSADMPRASTIVGGAVSVGLGEKVDLHAALRCDTTDACVELARAVAAVAMAGERARRRQAPPSSGSAPCSIGFTVEAEGPYVHARVALPPGRGGAPRRDGAQALRGFSHPMPNDAAPAAPAASRSCAPVGACRRDRARGHPRRLHGLQRPPPPRRRPRRRRRADDAARARVSSRVHGSAHHPRAVVRAGEDASRSPGVLREGGRRVSPDELRRVCVARAAGRQGALVDRLRPRRHGVDPREEPLGVGAPRRRQR